MDFLQVDRLPRKFWWNNDTLAAAPLHNNPIEFRRTLETMMSSGIITQRESFGFAMADPRADYEQLWDNPEKLIALVAFWGPDGLRLAANAVRKIRAAAREGIDTQTLRLRYPGRFLRPVESQEKGSGSFKWGDFPFDGAVWLTSLGRRLLGAVSAYPQEEDPIVAALILGRIGLDIYQSDQKLAEIGKQ